jgi:hypothetical protein
MTQAATTPISEVDRDCFERALAVILRHREPIYRLNFKRRLDEREEPRDAIGCDAAKILQQESLGVAPWMTAPHATEIGATDARGCEHRCTRTASRTLELLLNAGLSRYEHDRARIDRLK